MDDARVVALALQAAPGLAAAQATLEAALESARAAALARLPELSLGARYTRQSSIPEAFRSFEGLVFPQLLDAYSLRATLTVPLSDAFLRQATAARAAGLQAQAQRLELALAQAQLEYQARAALLQWRRALSRREAAAALLRTAQEDLALQQARLREGATSPNAALTFEVARDEAELRLSLAEAESAVAQALLRGLLPAALASQPLRALPFQPDEAPEGPPPLPMRPPENLEVAARALQLEQAQATATAAWQSLLPSVAALGAAEVSAPNPRAFAVSTLAAVPSWEVGLSFEWSLSALLRGSAEARAAEAQARAAGAQRDEARRRVDAEWATLVAADASAPQRLALAARRLRASLSLAQARRAELAAGTAVAREVVLAEADVARARDDWVDAKVAQALARARAQALAATAL